MARPVRDIVLAGAICATVTAATAGVTMAASRSPDPHLAAGVFPPWWPPHAVLAAAHEAGMIRDLGAVPFIVVVRDPGGRAEARLRAAGALFSVAPAGSAACGN